MPAVVPPTTVAVVISRAELAAMIDHTLLKPEATEAEVVALCEEADALGTATVCVSPSLVAAAVSARESGRGGHGDRVPVRVPIDRRSRRWRPDWRWPRAPRSWTWCIDLGAAQAGDWLAVAADVAAVRRETPVTLKVILESAALDPDQLAAAAQAALRPAPTT